MRPKARELTPEDLPEAVRRVFQQNCRLVSDWCLEWTGPFRDKRPCLLHFLPQDPDTPVLTLAHWVAWQIANGPLDPSKFVLRRTCKNTRCIDPNCREAYPKKLADARIWNRER